MIRWPLATPETRVLADLEQLSRGQITYDLT
jgi:hypothetical protein